MNKTEITDDQLIAEAYGRDVPPDVLAALLDDAEYHQARLEELHARIVEKAQYSSNPDGANRLAARVQTRAKEVAADIAAGEP